MPPLQSGSESQPAGGWGVEAVARRLGVAPSTVRSWHRRYGIGPTGHEQGRRRLYRPTDVARMQLMHRALVHGMSAAEAARWASSHADPELALEQDVDPGSAGSGAPPDLDADARGLGRAVLALDPDAVRNVVATAIAAHGVIHTWDELARPVLSAIAQRWENSGSGVEREHLLSECLVREFDHAAMAARRRAAPLNTRGVILACVPDEAHSLPLGALAAALAEQRVGVHLLGAALPEVALHDAVQRIAPIALFLWAQHRPRPSRLTVPPEGRSRRHLYVGGPGWTPRTTPAGATVLTSLATATAAIARTALGSDPDPG
jgi:MerR family transcriptional regulator, light-induced transcriptional regulator